MRFMMLYKPGRETDVPPTEKEMADMGDFIGKNGERVTAFCAPLQKGMKVV